MKKTITALLIVLFLFPITVHANELKSIRMTCYTHTGNCTASGVMPYVGGCAYQSKYIGRKVVIYENRNGAPGNVIGIYNINDTGYGAPTKTLNEKTNKPYGTIQLGYSIDIFQDSLEDCKTFIKTYGDRCFIRIL